MRSGPWFNIKVSSYRYMKSHSEDKTVVRSSYLHNGISCNGKMSSLYWIGAQTQSGSQTFDKSNYQWQLLSLLIMMMIINDNIYQPLINNCNIINQTIDSSNLIFYLCENLCLIWLIIITYVVSLICIYSVLSTMCCSTFWLYRSKFYLAWLQSSTCLYNLY